MSAVGAQVYHQGQEDRDPETCPHCSPALKASDFRPTLQELRADWGAKE